MLRELPDDLDKYDYRRTELPTRLQREWNEQLYGGPILNETRIRYSQETIPNPLQSDLAELSVAEDERDELIGYFSLQNLKIKEFPELKMATFVDVWILRTHIYNQK